jgi:prevent-host-death family protein
MVITATELKSSIGKYLSLVEDQDVYITKNGKTVAKLSSTKQTKVEVAKALFGIVKNNSETLDQIREERLARYESSD